MPILTLASNFTNTLGESVSLTSGSVPDEVIPFAWLLKGFPCTPFVIQTRKDGTTIEGTQIKGFEPQTTVDGYRQELVDRINALGYPIQISTDMVSIACKGMVNIDIDMKGGKDGEASWQAMRKKYNVKEEGSLFEVKTRNGGRHLYFKCPEGHLGVVGSVCWTDSSGQSFDGVDIRSLGNLLYAPMVIRQEAWSPGNYAIVRNQITTFGDLPLLSDELYQEMVKVTNNKVKKVETPYESLDSVLETLSGTSEGSRNVTLHRSCCSKVSMGWSDNEVIEYGQNLAASCTPPMDRSEALATIYSSLTHASKPRERMLRKIRERYVTWMSSKSIYVIDLKRAEGSNRFELQNFLKGKGSEFRMLKKDFFSDTEAEADGASKSPHINVFDFAQKNGYLRSVDQLGYRPGAGKLCAVDAYADRQNDLDVRVMYNTYQHPKFEMDKATSEESAEHVKDWLLIAKHLCSDNDGDLALFLDWLAYAVQNPTQRINFAPYFISIQGTGRGTVIGLVSQMLGSSNVADVNFANVYQNFNSLTCQKRLVWIDEIPPGQSAAEQSKFIGAFNKLVTEPTTILTLKGLEPVEIENYAVVILSSNFREALKVSPSDRRILPFVNFSEQYKPSLDVYERLDNMRNAAKVSEQGAKRLDTFLGHLYNFLRLRDVSKFKRGANAPLTSTFSDITDTSRSDLCRDLEMDVLNKRGVFRSEVTTGDAIIAHCKLYYGLNVSMSKLKRFFTESTNLRGELLFSSIVNPGTVAGKRIIPHPRICKADLVDFSSPCLRFEAGLLMVNPPPMYAIKGAHPDRWRGATNEEILAEYMKIANITPRKEYISTQAEIDQLVKGENVHPISAAKR